MLLEDPSPRLRDRIVAHLSISAPLSVGELHLAIVQRGHLCSLKAIYKELAILVKAGIVIRSNGSYQLSLAWVFDAISYTDFLAAQIEKHNFGLDLLPGPNKHRVWKLREHVHVDRLWAQITGILFTKMEAPTIYQALPHRWWPLLHQNLGRQYRQTMNKVAATSYMIIGGDTYLDRLFLSYFPRPPSRCLIVPDFFRDLKYSSVTLIGDYLINVTYPQIFITELKQYFQRIRSKKGVLVSDVQHLFRSHRSISLRIEHNKKKALRVRSRFERYF